MYKELLKNETDRVICQYRDEFIRLVNIKPVNIDEYLKYIEIDIEANDAYDYNSLIIDNHFNKPIISDFGNSRPNFDAFYIDFYQSVKEAFLMEVESIKHNGI